MIAGIFHKGSGLGNQLHRYIATRVLATDKGYDWSMIGNENFKGSDFMSINRGSSTIVEGIMHMIPSHVEESTGKEIIEPNGIISHMWEEKTNYYNPNYNFLKDNVVIDGEFQDIKYFEHRLKDIKKWLKVKYKYVPKDKCIIGFRGGEYYLYPELGLPKSYFEEGIKRMKEINPNMKFEVHTDDPVLAKQFFPDYKIIRDIGENWRSIRYAKYALISNSSFYILPRLLRKGVTIAPVFWARHNTGEWSMPQNYYKEFIYV